MAGKSHDLNAFIFILTGLSCRYILYLNMFK